MKTLILISALSLTVPFAYAEQPATITPEGAPAASFSQIDTDEDGMISRQEASSFSAVEGTFEQADANKDGVLDTYEFASTQQ